MHNSSWSKLVVSDQSKYFEDPCISTGEPTGSYPPYDDGKAADIWVKTANGSALVAKVWPADVCNFPDFFKPETEVYSTLIKI